MDLSVVLTDLNTLLEALTSFDGLVIVRTLEWPNSETLKIQYETLRSKRLETLCLSLPEARGSVDAMRSFLPTIAASVIEYRDLGNSAFHGQLLYLVKGG